MLFNTQTNNNMVFNRCFIRYTFIFSFFYSIIFYIFENILNTCTMDKPMNRIKEVLEEKGIKQTWLAEKLGKSFCIENSYVCNRRHQA